MEIGNKIKRLRLQRGLTQEELAARTELSKGFISQLERDITSPSIATLLDILEALGADVAAFFNEAQNEKVVYGVEDMFVKEAADGSSVRWLVTNAQRNALEPILVTLPSGTATEPDDPHEGEEFGYVLQGTPTLLLGEARYRLHKGDSFYFRPAAPHYLRNSGKSEARILLVSTPPSF
ncbi:MAG: helix-turn-helix domain-containing protein [Candidatus Aphodomorpha sp.]